ncbi:MAG: PP2C family protein-serine/threonine phosphatase [Anaerolineae bacterium]
MTQPSTDRLALLYRVSQTFNSSLDLDQVLNSVMDEVIAATRAERGFLMLRDADGRLRFRAARGLDQRTIDEPEFQVSRGVIERVAQEGRSLLTSNAQSDARLGGRESVVALRLRSILCVPLQHKGAILGVIYVDNRLQAGIFKPDDLELLTAISSSAAAAIENARLYQVAVEKGRLERELQVAREMQVSLLPRETPHLPGWEFAAYWQPAREVAGDFYDFIALSRGGAPAADAPGVGARPALGEQQLGLVIADVSDKGMPAALFMALTRSIVRASMAGASSPADGIVRANRLICADAMNGMFVTLFYAQLNPATGELMYVNAGHNPPLLYRADRDELMKLTRTGMALGLFETAEFEQRTVRLNAGDFVVLYTDGVTEALDAQGQEFGEERLRRVILDSRRASAQDIITALQRATGQFAGATAPFDDSTLVIAKRV